MCLTASGITANIYRVCGFKAESTAGRVVQAAVLVVAGPNVLFEKAMRGCDALIHMAAIPGPLVPYNGALYYVAFNWSGSTELWKTDGTPAGTAMVKTCPATARWNGRRPR